MLLARLKAKSLEGSAGIERVSLKMIDLGPQPDLRSARLSLTPFVARDAQAVFEYAADPEVARHTSWKPHRSLADATRFIAMVQAYQAEFCWALRFDPMGPAYGAVEFALRDLSTGSVHYVLARPEWNKGLMTEAVATVLRWAFQKFDSLERVVTTATLANVASRRVLEKCGFEFAGTVTENWAKFNEPVELALYELSKKSWLIRDQPAGAT